MQLDSWRRVASNTFTASNFKLLQAASWPIQWLIDLEVIFQGKEDSQTEACAVLTQFLRSAQRGGQIYAHSKAVHGQVCESDGCSDECASLLPWKRIDERQERGVHVQLQLTWASTAPATEPLLRRRARSNLKCNVSEPAWRAVTERTLSMQFGVNA